MFFLLWLSGAVGVAAFAEPLPEWVQHRPPNNRQFKHYLGRSGKVRSEKEALREANQDAAEQAIKENFGVYLKVDLESFETLDEVKLSKRMSEKSEDVRLVGFEPLQTLIQEADGGYRAHVLYRYPVSEISMERDRLKRMMRAKSGDIPVHEIGGEGESAGAGGKAPKGSVEIHTLPPGAEVKVDHRSWGRTPVRIRSEFEAGEHLVDLLHPDYEPSLNGKVIVVSGQTVVYRKTLKRREIELEVRSNPSGALLMVNGRLSADTTPTTLKAFLGEEVTLSLSHPEVHPHTTRIRITEGMELPEFNLVYRPARLLLDTLPGGAEVYIDSKRVGKTGDTPGFAISHGQHEIRLRLKGHVDDEFEVEVKGGETKLLPTRVLVSESADEVRRKKEAEEEREQREREKEEEERERKRRHEEEEALDYRKELDISYAYSDKIWYYGLGWSGLSSTLPLRDSDRGFCCLLNSLGMQKRMYRTFYLRGDYTLWLGQDFIPETKNQKYDEIDFDGEILVSHDLNLGLPYYIDENFHLGPEGGVLLSKRHSSQGRFEQSYWGINLGWDPVYRTKTGFGMMLKFRRYSGANGHEGTDQVMILFNVGAAMED
jgi:hypothetical protein